MGDAQQRHSDLHRKRRQQQFDVPDPELTQPADVAANQDGDGQRRSDDREEEEHRLAGGRSFEDRR